MAQLETVSTVEDLKRLVGQEIRVGDWFEVTQERVDAFAEATGDRQWIHVDPERAREGPFGGTIAHGHPLGATGAGLMAKMLAGLEATDGQLGLQVMCIGHGMSTATIIERI